MSALPLRNQTAWSNFDQPGPSTTEQQHDRGSRTYREQVLPIVRGTIERLTTKECASLFDVQPSAISDAIAGRDRKHVQLEWLVQLLMAAPEGSKLELLTTLCRIAGYKAPERARELTPEEQLRIYKRYAERVPGMAELIAKEIEGQ